MPRKLTGVVAAVAAGIVAVLVVPAGAFACGGGGTSATAIYTECGPNATGGTSLGAPGQKPVPVSKHVQKSITHVAKKNKVAATGLEHLMRSPSFGGRRSLTAVPASAVAAPSTLNAVFDVGAGPIALIVVLAGSAVLLLAATGWRGWRRWRGAA